ncbi:MAG TPA: hypothetical protein VM821_04340 [Abditibacteriaceae bacterium]|nr:hypothetical protein [Abditibacteriaceae bacterium]
MQNVKRIEIITNARQMGEVCRALEAHGVTSYSVVNDVTGRGERGVQTGDDLSGAFNNSYLLTACLPEKAPEIVETVRPILRQSGGVCLVSDAQWVIH